MLLSNWQKKNTLSIINASKSYCNHLIFNFYVIWWWQQVLAASFPTSLNSLTYYKPRFYTLSWIYQCLTMALKHTYRSNYNFNPNWHITEYLCILNCQNVNRYKVQIKCVNKFDFMTHWLKFSKKLNNWFWQLKSHSKKLLEQAHTKL